jgi:tetratricopeptide (TPR) repeat protein
VSAPPSIADAFRKLQAGDAPGALAIARRIAAEQPSNPRALLAAGIALRMAGRLEEAAIELEAAQRLDTADHASSYEMGVVRQQQGRFGEAIEAFERCARLRPGFFAAHFSLGLAHLDVGDWARAASAFRAVLAAKPGQPDALLHLALALARGQQHDEAEKAFVHALAANPHHAPTLKLFGQYSASRGNVKRAASLFSEAARADPADEALPMFVAQAELLLGRFAPGWAAYARREERRRYEAQSAARGAPYRVMPLEALAGREITIVGEQGLGDALFFLRWAPRLGQAGARVAFAGDERLHPLLARTGIFERIAARDAPAAAPILAGDLPSLFPDDAALRAPSLRIEPLPGRVRRWRATLEALGPRPWVGAMWRAGTPKDVARFALAKAVPVELLFAALAPMGGTVVSLQRSPLEGEIEAASRALGRRVHDLAEANADLEDALAVVSLLDRHATVSNTNVHLAAAAGASADVLVPYPPEWRWRLEGDSPWFPGFAVHRQRQDGDWMDALESLRGAGSAGG